MISIKKNDYVTPTEVRDEVVQGICEAFLSEYWKHIYHPGSGGRYRSETRYIVRATSGKCFTGFTDCDDENRVCVKFNGEEMRRAFQVLIENGYFMWRVYEYGSWLGYQCTKTPVKPYENAVPVYSFNHVID